MTASTFRKTSVGTGIAVTLVGSLVLASWLFDLPFLKSLFPGLATMKANAAIGFVLSGVALCCAGREAPGACRNVRSICGALVLLLGLFVLWEYLAGASYGVDELISRDPQTASSAFPGRMSLVTALSFALTGSALLILDRELSKGFRPAQWLALAVAMLSSVALIGYLYGAQEFYEIGPFSSLALHTALSFEALSIGVLLARPGRGLMSIASAPTGGGKVFRRSIPLAVLSLLVLGWLRLWGQRAGFYDTNFGVAMLVLAAAVVVSTIIWLNAGSIHREEMRRAATQEALRDADVRYSTLVEQIPHAVIYVTPADAGLSSSYVSPQIEAMLGFRPREWTQQHGLWSDQLHPEDRHRALSARADHSEKGEPFDEVYRLFSRDGRTVWVQDKAILVRDEGGRPKYSQGVMIDITQRKEAEDAAVRLNAQLEERVRLRTVQLESVNNELEAFSYSVSHDLRAPLRAIDGFSRILQEDYGSRLDAEGQRLLSTVRNGTKRMGSLIEDLLAFSQSGRHPLNMTKVAPAKVARETMASLDAERRGRTVDVVIGDLPECRADSKMVAQVFVNLLANALKFTRTREAARIEIGSLPSESDAEEVYFVKDNGVGFDMQYAGKLFGVFQRLHRAEDFEGTGVGLAFVQRIINRHGGRIWAKAEIDKGATFTFTLPALEPNLREARPEAQRRPTLTERAVGLV